MILLEWNDSFSVGDQVLDDQHKELFVIINDMAILYYKKDEHRLVEIIDRLLDYADSHFALEEEFMEKIKYPKIEEHKVLHREMIEQAKFLKQEFKDRPGTAANRLSTFAAYWLTHHINEADYGYIEYAKKYKEDIT